MRTLALLLLSLSSSVWADDYLWFERDWIVDVDATFTANPQMQNVNPETREKFNDRLREARWRISDGMLTSEHQGSRLSEPYSIRTIDASRFELIVNENGDDSIFAITKTSNGFCARLDLDRFEPPEGIKDFVECYVPEGP
jgi:hypothetical protein